MNPIQGINPHGLEKRMIHYHVVVNDKELTTDDEFRAEFGIAKPQMQMENGLYCWAGVPKELRENFGLLWTTQKATSRENYSSLKKYASRKMEEPEPGDAPYWATAENGYEQYMVVNRWEPGYEGDANNEHHLYAHLWYNWDKPEYATVVVVDTSGSMYGEDYTVVKYAITQVLREYVRVASAASVDEDYEFNAKVILYSGTYLSNIKTTPLLGTFDVVDNKVTVDKLWKEVSKTIDSISKHGSSEAMLTLLYFAICKVYGNFLEKDAFEDGYLVSSRILRCVNFVLLTDESIVTSDTFVDVTRLSSSGDKWYSNFYHQWQSNATNKFPVDYSAGADEVTQNINAALKQLSYFFGANLNWVISKKLSPKGDVGVMETLVPCIKGYNVALWKGEWPYGGDGKYHIRNGTGTKATWKTESGTMYDDVPQWTVPSSFNIRPLQAMPKITFRLKTGYFINSGYRLKKGDMYNGNKLGAGKLYMHGADNKNPFFFKYPDDKFNLPNQTVIGHNAGYSDEFQWMVHDVLGSNIYNKGQQYTVPSNNWGSDITIDQLVPKSDEVVFRLVNKYDTSLTNPRICGCGLDVYLNGVQMVSHIDNGWNICYPDDGSGFRTIKYGGPDGKVVQGVTSSLSNGTWNMSWN